MTGVLKHALVITSFVLIMMLLIEYINVQTRGVWQRFLRGSQGGQVRLGAILGATPGCLGAFTAVSLYSHRSLSFGALVAAMIATSGDEAFVLFSMVPAEAAWLTLTLFLAALAGGWLTDRLFKRQNRFLEREDHELELHEEEVCHGFSAQGIVRQLKNTTFPRALLLAMFGGLLFLVLTGMLGGLGWDWKKLTFTVGAAVRDPLGQLRGPGRTRHPSAPRRLLPRLPLAEVGQYCVRPAARRRWSLSPAMSVDHGIGAHEKPGSRFPP